MNAILLINELVLDCYGLFKKTACWLVGVAAGTLRPHRPTLNLTQPGRL